MKSVTHFPMARRTIFDVLIPCILAFITIIVSCFSLIYYFRGILVNRSILMVMTIYQVTILLYCTLNVGFYLGGMDKNIGQYRLIVASMLTLMSITVNLRILDIFRILNQNIKRLYIYVGHVLSMFVYLVLCADLISSKNLNTLTVTKFLIWISAAVVYDNIQQMYLLYIVYNSITNKHLDSVEHTLKRSVKLNAFGLVLQWAAIICLILRFLIPNQKSQFYLQLAYFFLTIHGSLVSVLFVTLKDLKFSDRKPVHGIKKLEISISKESQVIPFPNSAALPWTPHSYSNTYSETSQTINIEQSDRTIFTSKPDIKLEIQSIEPVKQSRVNTLAYNVSEQQNDIESVNYNLSPIYIPE